MLARDQWDFTGGNDCATDMERRKNQARPLKILLLKPLMWPVWDC